MVQDVFHEVRVMSLTRDIQHNGPTKTAVAQFSCEGLSMPSMPVTTEWAP